MSGMAMPGMTMGGHGAHPSGGLPGWVGLTWALAFAVLLAWHARYAWRSHGAGRAWHAGHVAMAATMVAMYVPSAAGTALIGHVAWPVPVALAGGLLAVGLAGQRVRAALWLLTAVDVAAMAAMGAPGAGGAVLASLLAATMCAAMIVMVRMLPAAPPAVHPAG